MNPSEEVLNQSNSKYLLALHSSSETLGVAILDLNNPDRTKKSSTFKVDRALSNQLFSCINKVLEKSKWRQINRVAVAKGPGGFTGTRVTVAMARILAQQLNCSLDAFSTFELMAARLVVNIEIQNRYKPFWITSELRRRGVIAGQYQLIRSHKPSILEEKIIELKEPHLLVENKKVSPAINASNNVELDIIKLLDLSYSEHKDRKKNKWEEVLPIYPTSPIDK